MDPTTKIGDLTVGELLSLLAAREDGLFKDKRVARLTVEEFSQVIVSAAETKAYHMAQRESEIAQRVFKDAEGLLAASAPSRITSMKEAEEFGTTLKNAFTRGGAPTLVVAVAVVSNDGYTKPSW